MIPFRLLTLLLLLPLAAFAAERSLKIDKARSFLDVDVDATKNFTAHLDNYEAKVGVDAVGKIKTTIFTFRFADLKTGNEKRDTDMIKWLGGNAPAGRFELGAFALTPNGQGQASGRLTFHGVTERVEFPVEVTRTEDTYTITGETTFDHRTWNLKIIRMMVVLTVDPKVRIRFKLIGTLVEEAKN